MLKFSLFAIHLGADRLVNYCTLAAIKERLQIDPSDTNYDVELLSIRNDEEAWIDNRLQNHTSIPLSTVPDLIAAICADRCAIKFRMRRVPSSDAANALKILLEMIEKDLDDYIQETYKPTTLLRG